jgi:Holliday junction resolvase RusA-like endonuclease
MGPDLILTFLAMPIGPSVNAAYATGKYGRRFKSKEMRDWEKQMDLWWTKNRALFKEVKQAVNKVPKRNTFEITIDFFFEQSRILCKDLTPKRLDLDNRIKAMLDNICEKIGIDDCRIWKITVHKEIQLKGMPDECNAVLKVGLCDPD